MKTLTNFKKGATWRENDADTLFRAVMNNRGDPDPESTGAHVTYLLSLIFKKIQNKSRKCTALVVWMQNDTILESLASILWRAEFTRVIYLILLLSSRTLYDPTLNITFPPNSAKNNRRDDHFLVLDFCLFSHFCFLKLFNECVSFSHLKPTSSRTGWFVFIILVFV